jgi:hypothetical protein
MGKFLLWSILFLQKSDFFSGSFCNTFAIKYELARGGQPLACQNKEALSAHKRKVKPRQGITTNPGGAD